MAKQSSWVEWYNKGPRVIATRLRNRRLECFYIPRAQWDSIWKPGIAPERIEFVAADPPRKVLAKLRPGLRFVVRLVFKRDPGGNSQPVTLRQAKGGASIRLTAKRVRRSNIFETGTVTLKERVRP